MYVMRSEVRWIALAIDQSYCLSRRGYGADIFASHFSTSILHYPGMLIGRVIGDVVATQKVASHVGRKILVVQPLHLDGSDRGDPVLALDAVDAGVGERVLLTTDGFSAMTAVGRPNSPIDSAVIGVIDSVDLHGESRR